MGSPRKKKSPESKVSCLKHTASDGEASQVPSLFRRRHVRRALRPTQGQLLHLGLHEWALRIGPSLAFFEMS
jgi:hypothetical protein